MSLNLVAVNGGGWAIEETNTPDAYIIWRGDGEFIIDPTATGGCWILRDGLSYLIEPAGQPFMAVSSEIITASTEAVALNTAGPVGVSLTLKNTSANAADLGGSGVEAAAGFGLAAGASVTIALKPGDVLYAIRSAGADATIAVLRT